MEASRAMAMRVVGSVKVVAGVWVQVGVGGGGRVRREKGREG